MPQHERQGRRGVGDHQIGTTPRELDAEVFKERRIRRVAELLVLEVLRVRVNLDGRVRKQHLTQRRVEGGVAGKSLWSAMDDQHAFDRRLRAHLRLCKGRRDGRGQDERTAAMVAHQNDSFAESWIWRDEPASPVGSRVRDIFPNVGLPTTLPGGPKLGWLNRSNASARNCTR